MPLIPLVRALLSLFGFLILALVAYLLWTWWRGDVLLDPSGVPLRVREDWRLWLAVGVVGWSLGGRAFALLFLAKADIEPTRAHRGGGVMTTSPTGATLYVESEGGEDGPVVIATHGWGLDSTIWQYLKRRLGVERSLVPHRLVTWDLPGLGQSKAPPTGEIAVANFATDLAQLIEEAAPRPVILIGHSIGGMTIQTLARDRPALFSARVVGVVLLNTTYTNPLRTMVLSPLMTALRRPLLEPMFKLTVLCAPLAWLSAWQSYLNGTAHLANRLQFGRAVTRSQLEHTTLLGTRNSQAVLAKGNLAMFDWDASGAIAAMACPVLIIGGTLDLVTKLEASEALVETASAGSLDPVTGVNHMGFLERDHHYNGRIAAFVAESAQDRPLDRVDASASLNLS
ncbi:alpha/beta fold hydrolase [Brevundimonas sp.]|jgi:pimeloyl-ACP methyl ester carboxylesterase|uniref:alpha/beta fold hydrolase n=1 Tax=Brevundimonas sp. TaxID=1871086 RepID=UPI003563E661